MRMCCDSVSDKWRLWQESYVRKNNRWEETFWWRPTLSTCVKEDGAWKQTRTSFGINHVAESGFEHAPGVLASQTCTDTVLIGKNLPCMLTVTAAYYGKYLLFLWGFLLLLVGYMVVYLYTYISLYIYVYLSVFIYIYWKLEIVAFLFYCLL